MTAASTDMPQALGKIAQKSGPTVDRRGADSAAGRKGRRAKPGKRVAAANTSSVDHERGGCRRARPGGVAEPPDAGRMALEEV
jgi:hypothetical protein